MYLAPRSAALRALCALVSAAALAACAGAPDRDASIDDAPGADAARDATDRETAVADALVSPDAPDDAPPLDADPTGDAAPDAPTLDASMDDAPVDATVDAPFDAPIDASRDVPAADVATGPMHVHIDIDNFCHVATTPMSATVPVMSRSMFAFHNHSHDYDADVWMSYGGGYLDLAQGATWNDPIGHCNTPTVHDEYADISIAGGPTAGCPGVRFMIHCR